MSVFTDIAALLQATLAAAPALAGGRVWRDRLVPVISGDGTALNVRLDKTDGRSGGIAGAPTDWSTDYLIECYARVLVADQMPTEAVDPLVTAVWQRLAAASALPAFLALGVQDVLPDPRIEWDPGEGNTPLITATLHVRIIHRTAPGQLVPWDA